MKNKLAKILFAGAFVTEIAVIALAKNQEVADVAFAAAIATPIVYKYATHRRSDKKDKNYTHYTSPTGKDFTDYFGGQN
jgi:hypothetical protein